MCYCWPHQLKVPFLSSVPHPPQNGAPPVKSPYWTVRQSKILTGTAKASLKIDDLDGKMYPNNLHIKFYLYLFILLILEWDFSSAWLPHSWAVIGSFLIRWRETQSTFTSLPQEVTRSLSFVSARVRLRIWALPDMACTATRRKPFTSPFSLTMATRCTSGTGYRRLLR